MIPLFESLVGQNKLEDAIRFWNQEFAGGETLNDIDAKSRLELLVIRAYLGGKTNYEEWVYWAERLFKEAKQSGSEKAQLQAMQTYVYSLIGTNRLNDAETVLGEALELAKEINSEKSTAVILSNLGIVYQIRGDIDKAEEMHCKSLEINERLGRSEGMANSYGNLGNVYLKRGDKTKVRQYWLKALELYKKVGMASDVKKLEGWIKKLED